MDMRLNKEAIARKEVDRHAEAIALRRCELEDPTLEDIGYDSLDVVELEICVIDLLECCGITNEIPEDRWSLASRRSAVERDICTLLEGRDLN